MRRPTCVAVRVLVLALVWGLPLPAQDASRDAQRLTELFEKYRDRIDEIHGNSLYYGGNLAEAQSALETLESVENEILGEVRPVLAAVGDRYGKTAVEVNTALQECGATGFGDVGGRFELLLRGVERVKRCRKASATQMARKAKMLTGSLDACTPEIRDRKLEEAKALLEIGQRMDPENSELREQLASIQEQIERSSQGKKE